MNTTETKDGTIIEALVKPKSRDFRVSVEFGEIVIFCSEEPNRGKANKEIINKLSKLFDRRVEIVSGLASRQKKILIRGITKEEAERVLRNEKV